MGGQYFGPFRPHRAGADLSSKTNLAVKLQNDGTIVVAGAGEKAIGLLTDAPLQGEAGSVQVAEGGKWIAGAAFNAGENLTPDVAGKAVAAVAAGGDWVLAIAREPAAAAGDVVSVEIVHAGVLP